jgi:hypothetical protein
MLPPLLRLQLQRVTERTISRSPIAVKQEEGSSLFGGRGVVELDLIPSRKSEISHLDHGARFALSGDATCATSSIPGLPLVLLA